MRRCRQVPGLATQPQPGQSAKAVGSASWTLARAMACSTALPVGSDPSIARGPRARPAYGAGQ